MGIKRVVDTSFWTDGKVDAFTPEDKYFMLYLLTNPFTTQLGIYEVSIKQVAFQMGYSVDSVKALIDRFANKYGVIAYCKDNDITYEVAIKNFLRHSIIKGGAPVRDCLIKEMRKVKNKELIAKVFAHIKDSEDLNDTVRKIITEYEEKNGILNYTNEKQNDNENENENENDVSYHDSYDDSFNDSSTKPKRKRFVPPTIEEVQAYCYERNNGVDAERFIDYYTSNGWLVGKNKMKDWKAAVRTWEKSGYNNKKSAPQKSGTSDFMAELQSLYNEA